MSSHRTEFNASAITYVGNYRGSCLIRLNGQAIIIVKDNGSEINQWPYNCIRQFRAEDETGKFSFVSGRRGPYGVAEYNFSVPNNSLIALQSALTEFTGAQFSAVAPGSGTEQQPLQPQQPLPHFPSSSTLPRPPSSSAINSYTTTTVPPRHMTTGGRVGDTISSDRYVVDSVFTPEHNLPQLPPRDYNTRANTSSDLNATSLSVSSDEHSSRGLSRARGHILKSVSSVDVGGTYSSPRPSLPPPRRDQKDSSPEVLVPTSYEQHVPARKSPAHSPPAPPKKKSIFGRFRTGGSGNGGGEESKLNTESSKKSAKSSSDLKKEVEDNPPKSNSLHRQKTEPVLMNGTSINRKVSKSGDKKVDEEQYVQMSPKPSKKDSPYDHLPSEKEDIEILNTTNSPPTTDGNNTSTDSMDGKKSPFLEDFSDLDHAPRSRCSPTVKTRSITPEYAHRLRMMGEEGHSALSSSTLPTTIGRQSPSGKSQRSNTAPQYPAAGGEQPSQEHHASVTAVSEEDSSFYNVPRTLSANEVYNVPKSVLESPPRGRKSESEDQTYDAPRTDQSSLDGAGVRQPLIGGGDNDGLYKVPNSISTTDGQTYDAPRGLMKEFDDGNTSRGLIKESDDINVSNTPGGLIKGSDVYNAPRSLMKESDDINAYGNISRGQESSDVSLYNVPRASFSSVSGSNSETDIYNQPRPVGPIIPKHTSNVTPAPRCSYETIEVEDSRPIHSSRSFESLHRARIEPPPAVPDPNYLKGPVSPPAHSSPAPRGVYIDIDLERGGLKPAKHAPLPPLPLLAGEAEIAAEGVYAEIPEHSVSRVGIITSPHPNSNSSQNPYRVNGGDPFSPTHGGTYSELPPPRPKPLDSYEQQGLSEQRKLASEGYEFCNIDSDRVRSYSLHYNNRVRVHDASYPLPTAAAGALLEKYHINIRNSTPPKSRHSSENRLLDDISSKAADLFSSSTPLDDSLTDEYVIVTGPDKRPKTGHTLPQNVPVGVVNTSSAYKADESDEYELMSSAFVDQAKLRSPKYSTPNPSLSGGGYYSNSTTAYTAHPSHTAMRSSPGKDGARSHTSPKALHNFIHDDCTAGVTLDNMSPADGTEIPMYSQVEPRHQRLSSSLSTSSSAASEVAEEGGEGGDVSGMAIDGATLEKVNVGSPLDRTNSVDLRTRTRSLGNILENSITTTSTPSSPTPTPTPGTPPPPSTNSSKKHNYINITPLDRETAQKEKGITGTSQNKKKGPKPLPRSSALLRENSMTM